jgi:hypothetical protein
MDGFVALIIFGLVALIYLRIADRRDRDIMKSSDATYLKCPLMCGLAPDNTKSVRNDGACFGHRCGIWVWLPQWKWKDQSIPEGRCGLIKEVD